MTMKEIKRRTESVSSTQQVIKAMNLVATSKLQKVKARMDAVRPLFDETKRVIDDLKKSESFAENVFVKPREIKNTAYVIIMSDRGLCGGHNTNTGKAAMSLMNGGGKENIIAVGVKCVEYFRRRGKNIIHSYKSVSEREDSEDISNYLTSLYTSGKIDEAYIVYTQFESVINHNPCAVKLLPIGGVPEKAAYGRDIMEYEPSADVFLEYAVPLYLNVIIYGAMIESSVCEQAARMISMDSADTNADKIIDDLTLTYNRIRQSAITQEINEIVNGANAQK